MKIAERATEPRAVAMAAGEPVQPVEPQGSSDSHSHEAAHDRRDAMTSPDPLRDTDRYRLVQPYLSVKDL